MLPQRRDFSRLSIETPRQTFTLVLTIISLVASIGGLLAQLFITESVMELLNTSMPILLLLGMALVAAALLRQGRPQTALALLLAIFTLTMLFVPVNVTFLIGVICLIGAAIYPSSAVYIIVNLAVFGRVGYELLRVIEVYGLTYVPEGGRLTLEISSFIILSVTMRYFMVTAEQASQQATRSAELLKASADIGQILAQILDTRQLFPRAVDLIRDRFGYYHVQIFLIDAQREYAELIASTGEPGEKLMAREHKLPVGSRSVIGRVTQVGTPVMASNTDADPVHRRNELLPNTRSELALPIVDGDRILGALDVQSTRANAFDAIDVQALSVMANQIATAIRNARLFEAQATAVVENKRLLLDSETNLREIQRLNRQLTREAWERYLLTNRHSAGVMLSPDGVVPGADWTPSMTEAAFGQRTIQGDGGAVIAVPIMLRGEVLGAIEVTPGSEMRPDDTLEMVQAVAQRLAISLDNARLFEESQEAAYQEQRINEIVGKYQTVATIDDLLQFTLAELSESLGAQKGAIRLGTLPPEGHAEGEPHRLPNGVNYPLPPNGSSVNGGSPT